MRIRNVHEEFEAHLSPSPGSLQAGARGKAEWKLYSDGSRQCRVSLSRLSLEDGTALDLVVEGRRIAQLSVERGTARYRQETERCETVPPIEANHILQVIQSGQVILEGRFVSE